MKNHIDYINSSEYQAGNKSIGSMLRMFKGEGQVMQVNNCGNCHARRADITGAVLPGAEFMNDFIPELPTNTFFYADGQMNDEDYNFTSFLQSKMFHRGVQCTNCHNPHTGNLKFTASAVCSQCHAPDTFNIPSHTMHAENSEGSSCINCHMPSKLYMGVDLRHDHSFRIPRPDLTVKYGTPNTCNSCHKDKPAKWAEQIIKKNFGDKRKYHFSEDLIPGSRMDANSEAHLNKLLQDTATPNIIRATVLDYMSRMNNTNSSTIFIKHLTDTSAMVRFRSLKGLLSYDPSLWISYAGPLLQDPVRAVRIAAAELFMTIPPREVPPSLSAAFSNAKAEQERFIIYQTDFAQGNAQAGDFYRQQNDFLSAENFYKKAIAKDSQLTIARVNLASTLNANGKNEAALQQLLAAQKIEPASDHIYYNLALLYVEMKQPEAAEKAFQKAIALHTDNIKVYYNYALFLQQTGKTAEAEKIYLKALKMEPANGDVLYALTVMYMQQKNILKATETARKLKQYHGNNPNYQQLLQQLHV